MVVFTSNLDLRKLCFQKRWFQPKILFHKEEKNVTVDKPLQLVVQDPMQTKDTNSLYFSGYTSVCFGLTSSKCLYLNIFLFSFFVFLIWLYCHNKTKNRVTGEEKKQAAGADPPPLKLHQ